MLSFLNRLLGWIERLFNLVAGLALVLMVLVVVCDILGRSLGLWNMLSTVEQTTLYMMLLGFFGLSRCFRDEGNIVVDLATSGLSDRARTRIDATWALITTLVLLPLAWLVVVDGLGLHAYGRRSEILGISPLVHHVIAGLGLTLAGLVALAIGLRNILGAPPDGDRPDPADMT